VFLEQVKEQRNGDGEYTVVAHCNNSVVNSTSCTFYDYRLRVSLILSTLVISLFLCIRLEGLTESNYEPLMASVYLLSLIRRVLQYTVKTLSTTLFPCFSY